MLCEHSCVIGLVINIVRMLMHLVACWGGAAISHRDLVSIIPYSSVSTSSEADDQITAHHDPRRPRSFAATQSDKLTSSPARQEAIKQLVGYLEHLTPDMSTREMLPAVDVLSSPGSGCG